MGKRRMMGALGQAGDEKNVGGGRDKIHRHKREH